MKLDNIYMTVSQCSKYIGTSQSIITYWCRIGYIPSEQNSCRSIWKIKASDFANLLYYNPKYLEYYMKLELTGFKKLLRDSILLDLSRRPFVIDSVTVQNIFGVHHQTIWNWTKNKKLKPCGYATNRICIFELNEILNAFDRTPRLKVQYYEAYEKFKSMKGEKNDAHNNTYC